MSLKGKTIVLTGASKGFGLHLSERLLEEGAELIRVGRYFSQGRISDYGKETVFHADLASPNMSGIVDRILQRYDVIDCLVNNAGVQGPVGPTWETDTLDWTDAILTDLMAPILLCRGFLPGMVSRWKGKIVNLSGGGAASPRPNYSAYATAKAGLVRFSECLAAEVKDFGIDVNCVSPGKMPTGMLPEGETADPDAMKNAADLVVFLLSEESDGITGRLISAVWDDWRSLPARKENLSPELYTLRRIADERSKGDSV